MGIENFDNWKFKKNKFASKIFLRQQSANWKTKNTSLGGWYTSKLKRRKKRALWKEVCKEGGGERGLRKWNPLAQKMRTEPAFTSFRPYSQRHSVNLHILKWNRSSVRPRLFSISNASDCHIILFSCTQIDFKCFRWLSSFLQ